MIRKRYTALPSRLSSWWRYRVRPSVISSSDKSPRRWSPDAAVAACASTMSACQRLLVVDQLSKPVSADTAPIRRRSPSVPETFLKRAAVATSVDEDEADHVTHAGGSQSAWSQVLTAGSASELGTAGEGSPPQGGCGPVSARAKRLKLRVASQSAGLMPSGYRNISAAPVRRSLSSSRRTCGSPGT